MFGILADERQRYTLYYLTEQGGKAMHEEIAEQVAAWPSCAEIIDHVTAVKSDPGDGTVPKKPRC